MHLSERRNDQKADTKTQEAIAEYKGQADAVRHAHGKHNPVHLCFGYGRQLYAWPLGQRSGQRRNIQDDFTRFFYSYRRHDWLPVWYQTHAK